jgi:nucleoside-diphosphate-sugar epimerase
MKTVVVTGGAGAIGSWLVRRLLGRDVAHVEVVDDLSSGYEWLLP